MVEEKKKPKKCVVCGLRRPREPRIMCRQCLDITEAEGTREQFGEVKGDLREHRRRQWVAQYNKLVRKGLTREEIADAMGVSLGSLKAQAARARLRGLKAEFVKAPAVTYSGKRIEPQEPKQLRVSSTGGRKPLDHGVGKWGVVGCNCEKCLTKRRAARNAYQAMERAREKAKRQAAKDLPS